MYETAHHQDAMNPELDYRLGRVQNGIVGRRRARSIRRERGRIDDATFAIAARAAILLTGR